MPNRFLCRLDNLARKARPYTPFTELNTAYRFMDKNVESILDLGCGKGEPMKFINRRKKLYAVGADIFKPPLKECRRTGVYDDVVLCDVRSLPFKKKSLDVVLCLALIEHLHKEEGDKLLRDMAEIAKKQVIISTPVGKHKQGVLNGNPYQEHKYVWDPAEFRRLGYEVRGVGIRGTMGEEGFFGRLPKIIRPFR